MKEWFADMRILSTGLLVLSATACSGPFLLLPGGSLSGTEVTLDSASLPSEESALQLETNPSDPYSVNVGFRLIDGQIYIDPAIDRQWYRYIQTDPNIRIKFEGKQVVHPATAQVVTDAKVIAQFESDRIVLRLIPRISRQELTKGKSRL